MADELTSLFTPITVGAITLKNRIYSSGHAEAMAVDGRPGDRLRRYHETKARGGCALTIFGGAPRGPPPPPAAPREANAHPRPPALFAHPAPPHPPHRHDVPGLHPRT